MGIWSPVWAFTKWAWGCARGWAELGHTVKRVEEKQEKIINRQDALETKVEETATSLRGEMTTWAQTLVGRRD